MRQLFYYKMRQKFITKSVRFLLQNATVITKCDVYYKLRQYTVKIYIKNLQILVTEMFNVKNAIAPKIICDIFKVSRTTYNLRNKIAFVSNHVKQYTLVLSHFLTRAQNFGIFYRLLTLLTQIKSQVKKWFPQNCPCRICKVYTLLFLILGGGSQIANFGKKTQLI